MSVVDVAYGSLLPVARTPRWMTVVLAVAASWAGIVALVLAFAGPATYERIARSEGFERIAFLVPASAPLERRQAVRYDVATRVALHERTLRYVLSQAGDLPRDPTTRDPLFTSDEARHLGDVRRVFTVVEIAALVGAVAAVAVVFPVARAGRGVVLLLIRDAAVVATILVAFIAIAFALAFEPAFLLFHYVFFPQGDFLFDPATSTLLALYPEEYWYAVTLRIGATFILAMVGVAVSSGIALRSRGAR